MSEYLGAPLVDSELWGRIAGVLGAPYGQVKFLFGGHRYTVTMGRASPEKVAYLPMVRVDDEVNSDWISDCPEHVRVFWYRKKRYRWPKSVRDFYKKANRREQKHIEELYGDVNAQFEMWSPIWPSPMALIRHIRKTCPGIRVYEIRGIML